MECITFQLLNVDGYYSDLTERNNFTCDLRSAQLDYNIHRFTTQGFVCFVNVLISRDELSLRAIGSRSITGKIINAILLILDEADRLIIIVTILINVIEESGSLRDVRVLREESKGNLPLFSGAEKRGEEN